MRGAPHLPLRRALCVPAVILAIGGIACKSTPVTLGTTLTLTVNVRTSGGGDLPDSYSVSVTGPYQAREAGGSGYLCSSDRNPVGFGTRRADIAVPGGSVTPFQVSTRFEDMGPAECYEVELEDSDLPDNCEAADTFEGVSLRDSDATHDFDVVCHSTAVNATIRGVVRDTLAGPGLEGVYVQAIHETSGGLPPVQTDATGEYEITVSETGVFDLCAIGAIPPGGVPQRYVNTNCVGDQVTVTQASTAETLDLSIETGYYLAIIGGPFNYTVAASDPVSVTFDYRAWHRAAVAQTTTWIAVGLEVGVDVLDGQDTALGQDPGPFGSPTAAAAGSATVGLTAPGAPGSYAVYARLLAVQTSTEALDQYENGFPSAKTRNYIKIGEVTVTP